MKLIVFLLLVSTTLLTISITAQDQSSRYMKQHNSKFLTKHLDKTKESLLQAMESDDSNMQLSAIQTLRDLEIIFQDDKFSDFIEPLIHNVQDESENTQVRILSALALENLHSNKGDETIYSVAKSTSNQSLKDLCTVMSIKSFNEEWKLSKKP